MSTIGQATEWMGQAACAARADLPWLADSARVSRWDATAMDTVCESCPVQLECAAYVEAAGVVGGFWAGVDRDPEAVNLTGQLFQDMLPGLDGAA